MNGSSKFVCVYGFAEELDEVVYHGVSNWFISFRSLFTVYSAHFSYLIVFFSIISCGLLSYRHSLENGSKFSQFWWGALIQGIIAEQGITKKHWHAQAPIMFFGKQLPLHMVFLYPSILYLSMIAILRLKLNICVEPAAVGLLAMLMEIPFRMISAKFLHITYHDTEPTFYYKLSGVPWIELFSSLLFASSYVAIYHIIKLKQSPDITSIWDREQINSMNSMSTVMCGILSPIVGFLQKLVFFHVLYDYLNVNLLSCLFFTISGYLSFVICFEPRKIEKHITEETKGKQFLLYQLVVYVVCLLSLAVFGKPEDEISIGSHEPTGDCTTIICSWTPLGKGMQIRKYLCTNEIVNRTEFLYNFNCVPQGEPAFYKKWYTICGTAFRNRANFVVLIITTVLPTFIFIMKNLFPERMKNWALNFFTLFLKFKRQNHSVKRKKFLCADEVSSRKDFLYSFNCLEEGPPCLSAMWYTICGTPITNRIEFVLNIFSFIMLITSFLAKILFSDFKKIEAAKRLIYGPKKEAVTPQPKRSVNEGAKEEITVGFVFVKNNNRFLPKGFHEYNKKVT